MNDNKTELGCSEDLWQVLNEVNLNHGLSDDEFQVLEDEADSRLNVLARRHTELRQLQADCRILAQSLEEACQRLDQLDYEERVRIWDAFQYQMAYLQACLQRSFQQP
ncbi:hypothetical protein [Pseudomonas akapageensis]|uniref:hypothetical protein n=1 Tax=Pseudomonas akapageensis TaxID=2609961 RepID=UPI0014096F8B|nr:hypothetical protein [Pseudomonas akapageensis]